MQRLLLLTATIICSITTIMAQYKTVSDINYRADDDYSTAQCRMDIASPENCTKSHVIMWFHGGGLTGGGKHIPKELMRNNAIVVGVGYRLSPNVSVAQIVDDAACAVAWVVKNIENYGGDPTRIYIAGHSAGGFLASMVGLDKSHLARYNINADTLRGIIPFSGQMITHFEERRSRGISDKQPIIDSLAPLYHVRGDAPPILLITGDREMEMLGRYEENAYMWRMLRLAGHKHATLYELDGYDHSMCEPAYPLLHRFIKKIESAHKQ